MQANRMADALLIADLAGRDDLTRVQQLYMKKQPSPYMRVVKAIQGNDFVSTYSGLRLDIALCLKAICCSATSLHPRGYIVQWDREAWVV